MIEQLFVKNYGCLKDVATPKLGMMHAFIGPNDSGKSTLLRAVRLVTYLASEHIENDVLESTYGLDVLSAGRDFRAQTPAGTFSSDAHSSRTFSSPIHAELRSARLLRLDPDALRLRSELIPDGAEARFVDDRGHGLPGVYDTILNRGDDSFRQIRTRVVEHFPTVKNLRLRAVSTSEKEIEIELQDGTRVPAAQMSEGLLYFLAFSALPYLSPTSIVLVEEPENGLHPARIAEVVRSLRELSKSGTQVLIATHSPLVVNELQGDEVTVVTRDAQGTKLNLLKDTPHFAERSKVYAPGELWVSYANGSDEGPLLDPTTR